MFLTIVKKSIKTLTNVGMFRRGAEGPGFGAKIPTVLVVRLVVCFLFLKGRKVVLHL